MPRAIPRPCALATVTAAVLAVACTTAPSGPAPTGPGHHGHLAGVTIAAPLECASCHAPTGFGVDFSQNPLVASHGATYDPASGTCSNVYCHGNFAFGPVTGLASRPTWTDATPVGCTSCHGMPPSGHASLAGSATPASCNACHPQTVDAQGKILASGGAHVDGLAQSAGAGCTGCHGDPARTPNGPGTDVNLVSAPPTAPAGAPSYATGVHLGHVNPTATGAVMPPVACSECHPVPGDSTHATRPPPRGVVFGPLSTTGGAAPTWDPATAGCSATYCHGNFSLAGVTGSNATPAWTDTAALTCSSCHAMPPAGHPAYAGAQDAPGCAACHPESVKADGTIKAGGGHLNGKADGGACGSCHGLPPSTGRHLEQDHRTLRCDACHPTGYTSSATVAPFHLNGVADLGSQAGYSCGLTGCPTGVTGTCTNRCHTQPERW